MTPEERLTRIENAIHALVDSQERQQLQLEKHSAQLEKHSAQLERQSALLEQHGRGIRDLIVVSRTLVEAQQSTDSTIKQLIGTVDRMSNTVEGLSVAVTTLVKSFQKPNGSQ
jgi:methyl-accepting chemotaxis protein